VDAGGVAVRLLDLRQDALAVRQIAPSFHILQVVAFGFRDLCEALLGVCRDSINRCQLCDIRTSSCQRDCEFMSAVCEAAERCVDAYVASLELAPE